MPGGATSTAARVETYGTFQFQVDIAGLAVASFSECGGLEMTVKFDEVREGGLNEYVHKLPGRVEYGNLVLKHGYVPMSGGDAGRGASAFFTWCLSAFNRENHKLQRHDVTVTLLGQGQVGPIFAWTFRDAYPVKWSGPSFKAGDSSVAIESLELAHHGLLPQ
jgi:phage tail-like protein